MFNIKMANLKDSEELESAYDPTFGKDVSFKLDQQVGSASISPCGRDVVLASHQGLHIIDLDCPYSLPRYLPHYTSWEVADVQWSPFAVRDYWVASTSNQKALVWNLSMMNPRASIEHVLEAHARAITDINFSAHHPDILATCAVDSYIHCWDLRYPARPAMTFCDWFAGATQVKWNRQDQHILASSHDKFLRIWDNRKGAYPLRSIEAHATKIYGIDWNRAETNEISTCSLDKTIKFWDYSGNVDEPKWTIHTSFPVWRARHTPCGSGLLAMPQREDYDLHLYDRRRGEHAQDQEIIQPVHRFGGHKNKVKEFLWRSRGTVGEESDNREFQLVSWGTDRYLRLHRVDHNILQAIGYEKGKKPGSKINITRRDAKYKTFRETRLRSSAPNLTDVLYERDAEHDSRTSSMSRTPISLRSYRRVPASKIAHAGSKPNGRHVMDPISWMKGVKIGKLEPIPSEPPLSSILSPSLNAGQEWDTYESLAEEISSIADKFGKVEFHEADIALRYTLVSFPGPWGLDASPIYIKARISFPDDYPEEAALIIDIEKNASMDREIYQKITSEVQSLADAYLSKQRNSFEGILRYLLREQDLKESLLRLKESPDHTSFELQDLTFSSSEEDEDDVGRLTGSQALDMKRSDSMLAKFNSQYNVPSPRACGASWADDGHLVYFLSLATEKGESIGDLNLKGSERSSKNHRTVFEGFGRLHSALPASRKTASTLKTVDSDDSEYDDLSTSTSGSYSSSESLAILGAPRYHLVPSLARRGNSSETQRAGSVDESQRSGVATTRLTAQRFTNRTSVSICDLKDLLPSKMSLAEQYVYEGAGSCTVNVEVARRAGCRDLLDTWKLVDLILRDEVPLEVRHLPHRDESILVVARRALSPLTRKDSAIDLSMDDAQEKTQHVIKGSVKWGSHPFGQGLVEALFQYYEQIADVQMLAMLSCAFSETRSIKPSSVASRISDQKMAAKDQLGQTHSLNKNYGASSGYFQLEQVARSLLEGDSSKSQARSDAGKIIGPFHSANSSIGAPSSDPITPFSIEGTPPLISRPFGTSIERTNSHDTNNSSSPERIRHTHRSSSNLASAFAASLSRPFSFSASASSSPPAIYSKKRLSPAGSYLGAPSPGVALAITGSLGKSSTITEDPRLTYSLSLSDTEETAPPKKPTGFVIKLKNQDQFHNDGYGVLPLLDKTQEWRYHAYRKSYAHLLSVWGMTTARCKLLKFDNDLVSSFSSPNFVAASSILNIGKTKEIALSHTDGLRLDIASHCTRCSTAVPQYLSKHTCSLCKSRKPSLVCLFCASLIRGLASPCLGCGHVLHSKCRSYLGSLATSEFSGEDGKCISGCGCHCASHAVIEIEYPARRKSSSLVSETRYEVSEQEQVVEKDLSQENAHQWEDMAYESLARNLGARYLTPKPSQIWRGGG